VGPYVRRMFGLLLDGAPSLSASCSAHFCPHFHRAFYPAFHRDFALVFGSRQVRRQVLRQEPLRNPSGIPSDLLADSSTVSLDSQQRFSQRILQRFSSRMLESADQGRRRASLPIASRIASPSPLHSSYRADPPRHSAILHPVGAGQASKQASHCFLLPPRVKTQLTMLRFNGLVNRIGGPTHAGELVLV
jgi:hypothetical protein